MKIHLNSRALKPNLILPYRILILLDSMLFYLSLIVPIYITHISILPHWQYFK